MTDLPVSPPPLAKKSLRDRITYHVILWVNALSGIVMTVDLTDALNNIQSIQPYITPTMFKRLFVGLTMLNVAIHFYRNFYMKKNAT